MQFQGYKLVFRRYAHLYFIMCIDEGDNELAVLEAIHLFVEVLDNFFTSVTELDIVLNFHKVAQLLCKTVPCDVRLNRSVGSLSRHQLSMQKQSFAAPCTAQRSKTCRIVYVAQVNNGHRACRRISYWTSSFSQESCKRAASMSFLSAFPWSTCWTCPEARPGGQALS